MAKSITVNEAAHNGACIDGVLKFYNRHFNGLTAVDVDDILNTGADPKYLLLDGYGDGIGYGDVLGFGDGNGYGCGYGYGFGYGDGNGKI